MATQVRTLTFLPEIFQTETNDQFLSSTLDVLTNKTNLKPVQGYIGQKAGYGISGNDKYVVEPTEQRNRYQLEPSVAFLKKDTSTATDFIDYAGIINELAHQGAPVDNHNRLFANEFYTWDSFTNLDKTINYSMYYWLPLGPDAITISDAVTLSDIVGKKTYTSPSGLELVNGLKINFSNITPVSNINVDFYVEGVGNAITLVPADELTCTEVTAGGVYVPFEKDNFDTTVWSIKLYVPIQPDYIVISRGSEDRNAWSRGNRWFHQRVIDTTTQWLGQVTKNPSNTITRARRPIIEFESNLRLFNSGVRSAGVVDYIDTYTTSARQTIAGKKYGKAEIAVVTGKTTGLTNGKFQLESTDGLVLDQEVVFKVNPGESDSYTAIDDAGALSTFQYSAFGGARLNRAYYIKTIDRDLKQITLVDFNGNEYPRTSTAKTQELTSMTLTSVATIQSGARVVFAADKDIDVRSKVFNVSYTGTTSTDVAVMSEVGTVEVTAGTQVHVSDGPGNLNGTSWRFDGWTWVENQNKVAINQPPLFDVFDTNGSSLGDSSYYASTTFKGTKLFSYTPGVGTNDSILGFPVSYSTGSRSDFLFTVNLNSDTFSYSQGGETLTKNISIGFIHQAENETTINKRLGWVKTVAPSKQYQVFKFTATSSSFECDIVANTREEVTWAPVVAYVDGEFVDASTLTITRDTVKNTTTVVFNNGVTVGSTVSISLLSDQVSLIGYYGIPDNLQNNAFNANTDQIALGEVKQHYLTMVNNAPGIVGQPLGNNNYQDVGNITGYGNRIVKNSASLLLPAIFLRKSEYNLHSALRFSAEKYQDYKANMMNLVQESDYSIYQTPNQILEDVIARLTANRTEADSFFWTDMLPTGTPYISNVYDYRIETKNAVLPTSKEYDYTRASYECVYVYYITQNGTQTNYELLLNKRDYTIVAGEPSIKINITLAAGSKIVISEYKQTHGSYCPSTPSKLGMYPVSVPRIHVDKFNDKEYKYIIGHDGSWNKMYGTYIDGKFSDFRDMVMLEFEKRVYNNIKLTDQIALRADDILPGHWRKAKYSSAELEYSYNKNFLDWAGKNRIDYRRQFFFKTDKFSFNYSKSSNRLDGQPFGKGGWRGIYRWMFDTENPSQTPWEMLGLTDKPQWWDARYGVAPYTRDNQLLWTDLAEGRVWNNGAPFIVESRRRPGLEKIIPVDSNGVLLAPQDCVVGNYDVNTYKRDWLAGDCGPAEAAYLKSSTWPFDLMKLMSTFEPVRFYNYFADIDDYRYNVEHGQFLYKNRYHLNPRDLDIYGTDLTTAKHSYINWIVDYTSRAGETGATAISTTLKNIDVRLSYRLAGFSDKEYLKFFTENSTPSATSANLLIPDDSFDLMLYDSVPSERIEYSAVVVQKTEQGFTVWGNSLTSPHFTIATPVEGKTQTISRDGASVEVSTQYDLTRPTIVAYGTQYYTTTGVSEFLINYGRYLENQGITFDQVKNGQSLNWKYSVADFISWAAQTWEVGSTISLNPAAASFTAYKQGLIVQPLTIRESNFVLDQNLIPIEPSNLAVVRSNQGFGIRAIRESDTIAYTNLNLSSIEHAVVFNNETLFGDVIYNNKTGMRHGRLIMNGSITADWTGGITAEGFILNEGNIEEWNSNTKYPKGQIVTYKNSYWVAKSKIEPSADFDYTSWKESSYEKIKVGLLPNPSTLAVESAGLYDINKANLDNESDLLAFSLIGYRPRPYMSESQLSDISQINAYTNIVRNKGTLIGANAFAGAITQQGQLDYDIRENWAVKRGEFGSVLNTNYVEVLLNKAQITGNPGIVSFGDGINPEIGAHQTVAINPFQTKGDKDYINDLLNYGRFPKNHKFLPQSVVVTSQQSGLPSAGYVNIDDVKFTAFTIDDLNQNPDAVTDLYRDDCVWVANHRGEWDVFTPVNMENSIIAATNNFDDTVTLTFQAPHKLEQYDSVYIIQFDSAINGFYVASSISSATEIIVDKSLDKKTTTLTGTGIAFKLMSKRVSTTSDITKFEEAVKNGQFSTHRTWVDQSTDGEWRVLTNGPVYKNNDSKNVHILGVTGYGSSVAYTDKIGYLVVDGLGNIYLNGVKQTNKSAGRGTGTKIVAFGDQAYCSSPSESLMYKYDFSGDVISAAKIIKGTKYTIASYGTTDFTTLGAGTLWNDVHAWFTEETDTVPASMIVNSISTGHTILPNTNILDNSSANKIDAGTTVIQQTHVVVRTKNTAGNWVELVTTPDLTNNEKFAKGQAGQQTTALDSLFGIQVGDWVISKYFPFGTKVQSYDTKTKTVTFSERLIEEVLDTDAEFRFYRPISSSVVADNGRGIYKISKSVVTTPSWVKARAYVAGDTVRLNDTFWKANDVILTGTDFEEGTTGATWTNIGQYINPTSTATLNVKAQPAIGTTFVASVNGKGTGTVSVEFSTFSIGATTGEFAISQDKNWMYIANSTTKTVDVYINEVGTWVKVSTISGPTAATGFGAAIATTRDGSKLIIGAPNETVATNENAGAAYFYARRTENFLQSDRAVKIVPDQTYTIADLGGTDKSSIMGWYTLGAAARFRGIVTKDFGVWKPGNILTIADTTAGIKDVAAKNTLVEIGSYLYGFDNQHYDPSNPTQGEIVGTQIISQFDSFETPTTIVGATGSAGAQIISIPARKNSYNIKAGQLVSIQYTDGGTIPSLPLVNRVALSYADYQDTSNTAFDKYRSYSIGTKVSYVKNNKIYDTSGIAAYVAGTQYAVNEVVKITSTSGSTTTTKVYKCIETSPARTAAAKISDRTVWQQLTVGTILSYDSTVAYKRGTFVEATAGGDVYKCIGLTPTANITPGTDATYWEKQWVEVGLTKKLNSGVSTIYNTTFRDANKTGRYFLSASHNFSGTVKNTYPGSYIYAVAKGRVFKSLSYGSIVSTYDPATKKWSVTDKTGAVELRKQFVLNAVVPSAIDPERKVQVPRVNVFVDNKQVPRYEWKTVTGSLRKVYNYEVIIDVVARRTLVNFVKTPPIGSVVVVDFATTDLQQRVQSDSPRIGALFGRSVTTNNWGAEVFIGSPYESSTVGTTANVEGVVYRYTNGGQRYNLLKMKIGTFDNHTETMIATGITKQTKITNTILSAPDADGWVTETELLADGITYSMAADVSMDGFRVNVAFTGEPSLERVASRIAAIIDTTEPTNVNATAVTEVDPVTGLKTYYVQIENGIPGTPNDQVDFTSDNVAKLGMTPYTKTQKIYEYNLSSRSAFGYTVAMNQELNTTRDSLVVSAPQITALSETTFDFSDNLNDDDTIFDNGATLFIDKFQSSGAAYQYDYLTSSDNTLTNPGLYAFGQLVDLIPELEEFYGESDTTAGLTAGTDKPNTSKLPMYGQVLTFNDGRIVVGSPQWYENGTGRVTSFVNNTYESSWHEDKAPLARVDINRLKQISIYDTQDNTTIENLDYIDPAQGKHLAAIQMNVDYFSAVDPATYISGQVWGADQVGRVWMDTSNFRLMNYNQPDVKYNARYFGQAFPGSTVDLYTWIESDFEPADYQGAGFPVDMLVFNTRQVYDRQANKLVNKHYFWVKNFSEIPQGKTLAPTTLAQYILNPLNSGIAFLGPISTNSIGLFNCSDLIHEDTSALHLGYGATKNDDIGHSDWLLIQTGTGDSFLPGVPTDLNDVPSGLYLKFITSLAGYEIDTDTQLVRPSLEVPDKNLSPLVQHGVSFRPRQTMFLDRKTALKNFIDYANGVLALFPAAETRGTFLLSKHGAGYDTTDYWNLTDWWAEGFTSSTKITLEVDNYNSLMMIGNSDILNTGATGIVATLSEGMSVRVKKNGQGNYETYNYTSKGGWTRINVQNGTFKINELIYTTDTVPAQEIYWVVRWINEQLYTGEYAIERNNALMMMFNFIQSDSAQQQNYLPWLTKTSLIDVQHTIRQLLPYKKYQIQSSTLVNGFMNEIKPFHVFIKEFSYKYSGNEYFEGDLTDFDLPSKFRIANSKFISPILKQDNAISSSGEYLASDSIWQEADYKNWFNYAGISFSNQGAELLTATKVVKDVLSNDTQIEVESTGALPFTGSVSINGELIAYTSVDHITNTIKGISRAGGVVNGIKAEDTVQLVTKPVMIVNPGRGYKSAPIVQAYYNSTEYPFGPKEEATFMVTMNGDALSSIDVVNPGRGYPVTPVLRVSTSSIETPFAAGQVDIEANEIAMVGHPFKSGDAVVFTITEDSDRSTNFGLADYGIYYVSALNGNSIAFYDSYVDAMEGFSSVEVETTAALDIPQITAATNPGYYYRLQSPFGTATPMFRTGDKVRVSFNTASTANKVNFVESFDYYYIRIIESADSNSDNLYDYVSLHNSAEDAVTGANQVQVALEGQVNYLRGNSFCKISSPARTDTKRIDLVGRIDGNIAVTAVLRAAHGTSLVRSLKTAIKFDRVTYKTKVTDWEEGVNRYQEGNWDLPTWSKGYVYTAGQLVVYKDKLYRCVKDTVPDWKIDADLATVPEQWTPGVTYTAGTPVLYNTIIYRATVDTKASPLDGNNEVFSLAYWEEVSSNDPELSAADRVVGFYRPRTGMAGYTFSDLSQLMEGTRFPYQQLIDPPFDWGTTVAFVPKNVDLVDNTITLNQVKPLNVSYHEIVYGSSSVDKQMYVAYTPAATQVNKNENTINVTIIDNYSFFLGQPIRFITKPITYDVVTYEAVAGSTTKKKVINTYNSFEQDRTYYVGLIDADNSSIAIAYNSTLAGLIATGDIHATGKSINLGGIITLDISLPSTYLGATIIFTSGAVANVGAEPYFIKSISGATITVAKSYDEAMSVSAPATVFTKLDGTAMTTLLEGNMGVLITPRVPLMPKTASTFTASGFTTISLYTRTTATMTTAGDLASSTSALVDVSSTAEMFDNTAIKFGGTRTPAGITDSTIYFIDAATSNLANKKIAISDRPGGAPLTTEVTTDGVDMTVTVNLPYATVESISASASTGKVTVTLTGMPKIMNGGTGISAGLPGENAGIRFAGDPASVSGTPVTVADQYLVSNARMSGTKVVFDIDMSGTIANLATLTTTNLYAVFSSYIAPISTSYTSGEQVKVFYSDPYSSATQFYYVNVKKETIGTSTHDNVLTLHETAYDAIVNQNPIDLPKDSFGLLSKPQTIMQAAGPVAGVIGEIVPMTFELTNDSLGFGLTNNKTYWAKFVSTTTVALYKTKSEAIYELNQIPLLKQIGGQFNIGKAITVDVPQADGTTVTETIDYNSYDSYIISNNKIDSDVIVKGKEFEYGYGPEELLAGVITDGINFTVTTRPGATWDPTDEMNGVVSTTNITEKYAHTGFGMKKIVAYPSGTSTNIVDNRLLTRDGERFEYSISFANALVNPATVELYAPVWNAATSTFDSIKYYRVDSTEFTVNWSQKVVTLGPTLIAQITAAGSAPKFEVAVYDMGGASIITRGTTDRYPFRDVTVNGVTHSEILLDIPFSHAQVPSKDNFWLSAIVMIDGKKIGYYDGEHPLYDATAAMFDIQPQRTYDPRGDAYNPAKLVFNRRYSNDGNFASFAVSSDVLGMYLVEDVTATYQVPMTDNARGYNDYKVGVTVNNIRKTLNTDYTIVERLTNGGSKNQLITIKFTDGVVSKYDIVKITYEVDGISVPTLEEVVLDSQSTGSSKFDLIEFLGDDNYSPFSDIRVVYDYASTVSPNTLQARTNYDLKNGTQVIVSGFDTNGIIQGFPAKSGNATEDEDILSAIYYLRDVVYHNDNTFADTAGLYTFKLANSVGGAAVDIYMGRYGSDRSGTPSGLTFTITDNLIVEVDGVRYNGIAPSITTYGGTDKPINVNTSLTFPVPVYSLTTFDPAFLKVSVNGVQYTSGDGFVGQQPDPPVTGTIRTIMWGTNYAVDPVTGQAHFNGMDSIVVNGFMFGNGSTPTGVVYNEQPFDAGEAFDNQNIVNVIFAFDISGVTGITATDVITIEYAVSGPAATTTSGPYDAGDIITYGDKVYRAVQAVPVNNLPGSAGDLANGYWALVSLSPPPMYLVDVAKDTVMPVLAWNSTSSYAKGDEVYVASVNKVYEAIVAIAAADNADPTSDDGILLWKQTNWNPQSGWTGTNNFSADNKNQSNIGGKLTVYVPGLLATNKVTVKSFARTSAQSLKTQLTSDIVVGKITAIAATSINPARITTNAPHGLTSGDKVRISGDAAKSFDGKTFYISVVDANNVDLYTDSGVVLPATIPDSNPLRAGKTSFIQLIRSVNAGAGIAVAPAVIDQPYFNLLDESRIYVSLTVNSNDNNASRFYLSQDKYEIIQDEYLDSNNNRKTVNVLILLTEITSASYTAVAITSMIPTASSNEMTYRINATWDASGKPQVPFEYANDPNKKVYFSSIYREPENARTWVSQLVDEQSLYVKDPYVLVSLNTYNSVDIKTTTTGVNYVYIDGIDSTEVSEVEVYNAQGIRLYDFFWITGDTRTSVKVVFYSDPSVHTVNSSNNPIVLSTVSLRIGLGNKMLIGGEQLTFSKINLNKFSDTYGLVSGIRHAANTTHAADIQVYDSVKSLKPTNLMNSDYYDGSWYGNRIKTTIYSRTNGVVTFRPTKDNALSKVEIGDTIQFAANPERFGGAAYLYTGSLPITGVSYDNGTLLEFTLGNYAGADYYISPAIAANGLTVKIDTDTTVPGAEAWVPAMANKLGSKYLVINNAYGIEVGHYIQCADIAYSIQEGTTVVGIFDDLTLPASIPTKIVKISNGLLKDLPPRAGIQAGYTLNPLASNAKHVRVGEKIQLYTYSSADTDWVEIKSYSAITGTSTDILTVVDSYRSKVDTSKWIVKVAEAVSVAPGDRAEVALSEFTIIDKETLPEWAPGTNYTIGTRVVDSKGIVYKCISDNTAGVDSMPSNVRYWAPSEYGFTFNSYSDCFASSQRFGFRTATTLGSVVQYPGASLYLNTEAYIIFKTMDLPLQLNTSVQAEFIKYDGS